MKFLLITSLILLFISITHSSSSNVIEPVCKATQDYKLCTDVLQSDPRSASADTKGLALLMMDAAKNKTAAALNTMEKRRRARIHQPDTARAIQQCEEAYTTLMNDDIPRAEQALKSGNSKYAESMLASADERSNNGCRVEEDDGGFGDMARGRLSIRRVLQLARDIIRRYIRE